MKSDGNDMFDTPRLRYYKLRKEFDKKYLNPKAWDHEFDTREIVQAYHDLLQFLEKTQSFRDLTKSLKTDIPVDNVHLVLDDLPLPLELRKELVEYVTAGNASHEDQLRRIKEFIKMKKESGLRGMERKSGIEIMEYRHALRVKGVVHENIEEFVEEDKKKSNQVKIKEQNEILEIRQKVYSKIKKGLNAFSMLKIFKKKVEKFLENYRTDLSYHEEKYWREKAIITEKAVVRNENILKTANYSREDESLAPSVKNMFDEIKEELEDLKKIVDTKGEHVAEKVSKVIITKKAVGNRKQKKKIKATKHSKKEEKVAEKVSKVMEVKVDELNDLNVDRIEFDKIKEESW